jgi:hypothetical protein
LFHDLGDASHSAAERADWKKRESAGASFFDHSSCRAHLDVDLDASSIKSGSAYLRVADDPYAYVCFNIVPFFLLGQKPIGDPAGGTAFVSQLLQLFYSPELQQGMKESALRAFLSR